MLNIYLGLGGLRLDDSVEYFTPNDQVILDIRI